MMKTAISIPERVFQSAEQLALRLGVSRSELYAKAVAELIEKHRDDLVTSRLNDIYGVGAETSALDHEVALLQHRSITRKKR
jgi:metal-responsive CopG/Arc/MetJ family transcriptional regulator